MSSVSFPSAQISTQYPSAQLAFSPQSVSLPISVPNTNMRPQVLSPIQTQNGSNPGSSQSMTPFPGGNLLQGANLLQNMSNTKALTSQQMTQSQQNTPANTQPNQGILPSTQAFLQSKNQGATATQGLQKPQDPLVKALESLVPLQTFTQLQAMAQFQVQNLVQNPARPGNIFGQISANNMPRPSPQGYPLLYEFYHSTSTIQISTSLLWLYRHYNFSLLWRCQSRARSWNKFRAIFISFS